MTSSCSILQVNGNINKLLHSNLIFRPNRVIDDFLIFVAEVLLHEDSSDGEKVKKKSGRGRPVKKINYSEADEKPKKKRGRRKGVPVGAVPKSDTDGKIDEVDGTDN